MAKRQLISEVDSLAIAYLYSQGYLQLQIAETIGASQSVCSRAIRNAKRNGILFETPPQFDQTKISDIRFDDVLARIAPSKLTRQLTDLMISHNVKVPFTVRVFRSPYRRPSQSMWASHVKAFGAACAGYVRSLLVNSRIIGVSWGNSLLSVVTGIRNHGYSTRREVIATFVPLCGEPLGKTTTMYSASSLAMQLDEVTNRSTKNSLSLAAIPALIPKTFSKQETATIRKLMNHVAAYRDIFGNDANRDSLWISQLDTILTSVGSATTALGYGEDELLNSAGIQRTAIQNLIYGDISGVLVRKRHLDNRSTALVHAISERWTGVKYEHFKACSQKAEHPGRPGVIAIAIGEEKAEIVTECIRLGLINHLIIDHNLANRL